MKSIEDKYVREIKLTANSASLVVNSYLRHVRYGSTFVKNSQLFVGLMILMIRFVA
jgi:hypothetical protein